MVLSLEIGTQVNADKNIFRKSDECSAAVSVAQRAKKRSEYPQMRTALPGAAPEEASSAR